MSHNGNHFEITRTHGKFSEHPAHDLNEVLTHKETILRSIVDEKFFRSIQPYQHDHLITAAFEVYLLDNDLKEFADTCIRFIVHTIAKKQYYRQYDLLTRAHNHYYFDVLVPLLHDDTMQTAWEEYQGHFQNYVEACKEVMIKDLRARVKIV